MHLGGNLILPAAFLLAASFLLATECDAVPAYSQPNAYNEVEMDPESEALNELLARLARTLYAKQENNVKRGLDLGLGRGYSGSLTAKHLMGLASANYAGGPGRRRRSVPYFEEA